MKAAGRAAATRMEAAYESVWRSVQRESRRHAVASAALGRAAETERGAGRPRARRRTAGRWWFGSCFASWSSGPTWWGGRPCGTGVAPV